MDLCRLCCINAFHWFIIAGTVSGILTGFTMSPAVAAEPPGAAMAAVLGGGISTGLPLGIPPKPMTDRMLSVPPAKVGLFLHWSAMEKTELDASDRVQGSDPGNRTLALLSSQEVSEMFTHLTGIYTDALSRAAEEDYTAAALAKVGSKLFQTLLTHETAAYVRGSQPNAKIPVSGAIVCDASDVAAELSTLFEMIAKMAGGAIEVSDLDGLKVYRMVSGPPVPFEITVGNRYLVAAIGKGELAETVSRLKANKPAEWLQSLRQKVSVKRIANFVFLDCEYTAKQLGGEGESEDPINGYAKRLRSMYSVTGLDDDGVVIQSHFDVSEESQDSLQTFVSETGLSVSEIPEDASVSVRLNLDMETTLSTVAKTINRLEPGTIDGLSGFIQQAVQADLMEEIFPAVGDSLQVYVSPGEGGQWLTGLTGVLDLKNPAFMSECLTRLEKTLVEADADIQLRSRKVGDETLFYFTLAPGARGDDFLVMPSFCVRGNRLLASTYPQNVVAMLNRPESPKTQQVDTTPATVFTFELDEVAAAKLIYPAVQMFGSIFSAELAGETDGMVQLDFSYLPSLPAITEHLHHATTQISLADGVNVTRRQTLPPSGAGPVVAIAFLGDYLDRIARRRSYDEAPAIAEADSFDADPEMQDMKAAPPRMTPEVLAKRMQDAQKLLSQQQYAEAEKQLKVLLESVTDNSDLQLLCAKSIWLQDRNEDSLAYFEKAVQLNDRNIEAWFFSAIAYKSLQNREKAIEHFTKTIELEPEHKFAHYYRGLEFLAVGSRPEALADFTESIRLNPTFSESYYQRAYIHLAMDNNEAAIEDFSKRLSIKPLDTDSLFRRGELYEENGEVQKAIRDYNAFLGLKPDDISTLRARAGVFQNSDQDDLARADYTRLIELEPIKEDYANRALCWSVDDQNDKIIADYSSAIKMDPTYAFAYGWRAMAYQNIDDFENARQDYDSAIRHGHDENEITLGNYSWLLAACPDDAIRDGKLALKHGTKACELTDWMESWVIDNVAAAHAEMGDFDEAIKMANKAIAAAGSKVEQDDIQTRLDLYNEQKPARFK